MKGKNEGDINMSYKITSSLFDLKTQSLCDQHSQKSHQDLLRWVNHPIL